MYQLESLSEELWFCDLEHLYAHKASQDVLYKPNYNLWTRIRHYTESTRSAGSQYDLNQTRIYRLAAVLLQESDQTIIEALEPQVGDRFNQPWSNNDMELVLCGEQEVLEKNNELLLQQILDYTFDTSHPEYNKQFALATLQ
jgi:hypothetical protein